jgi:hypothetical protein
MLNLIGGSMPFDVSFSAYKYAWEALIKNYKLDMSVTEKMVPTTISWKVTDKSLLYENLNNNGHLVEQVHVGTVNDRYIASALLHSPIENTIWILKILERRKGSDDLLGLDSIDYLARDLEEVYKEFTGAGLQISKEENDMHSWLSLRFGEDLQHEAKFVDHLLTNVAVKELKLKESDILSSIGILT